jgi:hypothetical protein
LLHEVFAALHASHALWRDILRVARVSLIALGILILVGLVLSFLPSSAKPPLGEVTLENVDLVLYPAADPNAKWTFKAGIVKYNPDSRSSVATKLSEGKRLVKGTLDLVLKADTITIDSNDNLSTQTAEVYIPKGCWTVKLGQNTGNMVMINQDSGYQASFADVRGPNTHSSGGPMSASFDLEQQFNLQHPHDEYIQGGKETCLNGTLIKESQ